MKKFLLLAIATVCTGFFDLGAMDETNLKNLSKQNQLYFALKIPTNIRDRKPVTMPALVSLWKKENQKKAEWVGRTLATLESLDKAQQGNNFPYSAGIKAQCNFGSELGRIHSKKKRNINKSSEHLPWFSRQTRSSYF